MPKRRRKNVGEFFVGDMVEVSGKKYRILSFLSRRTAIVQSVCGVGEGCSVSTLNMKKVSTNVDNS